MVYVEREDRISDPLIAVGMFLLFFCFYPFLAPSPLDGCLLFVYGKIFVYSFSRMYRESE